MSRHYATSLPIDLTVNGAPSASLTPSASSIQTATFGLTDTNQAVAGSNWVCARGIAIEGATTFDQASSGGAAVDDDQLSVIFDSFATNIPLLGLIHDPTVFTGPRAKHVIEFVSNNYRYNSFARAQIASSDGDSTLTLYAYLPFGNNCFVTPEIFAIWTGFLKDMTVRVNLALSTAIAAFSTGAVIKTAMVVKGALDCVVLPQLPKFVISQWNAYTSVAASGNTAHLMQNVGQPGGLSNLDPGSRIAGIYELMSVLGLGGASTGDVITGFSCTQLGQQRTSNPWRFLQAYREMIGHAGPVGVSSVTDKGGNPYTLAAVGSGSFNVSTLMYMPWRTPAKDVARVEQQLRWPGGNITLQRDFSTVPTSGTHVTLTNELRSINEAQWGKLAQIANVNPGDARIVSDRALRPNQTRGQGGVFLTRR